MYAAQEEEGSQSAGALYSLFRGIYHLVEPERRRPPSGRTENASVRNAGGVGEPP
jgi:hypothetical protein